jgi:hypothetical protein
MQRENERGVPSHRWSVNPLAGGPRSAAKRATKIEGSGSATEMGYASDWRSATEMGSSQGFKPKRNMLSQGGGGGGGGGAAENTGRGRRKGNT